MALPFLPLVYVHEILNIPNLALICAEMTAGMHDTCVKVKYTARPIFNVEQLCASLDCLYSH